MEQNPLKVFKLSCYLLCLFMTGLVVSQEKQTKNYNESFDVKPDAEVDIDVSYADISFETWDKNQVDVEATIELEGASAEEAKKYFSKGGIEILGNSSKVEIRTSGEGPFPPAFPMAPMVVDLPDMEPLFLDLKIPDLPPIPEIPPIPELPPMPPTPVPNFDYEAYKKDGEKYLKKWKSEFDKKFDKEYRKKLEAWSEKAAESADARKKHMEEWQKEREKMMEEHEKMREEQASRREEDMEMAREQREQRMEQIQLAREQQQEAREEAEHLRRQILISKEGDDEAPVIFYRSSDGEGDKDLKIKKTIRIKLPKSVKLKLNVRHGEVKLAENTKDLQATLSYARLLAATIDGAKTHITASYSPVNVAHWNVGSLRTDFSEKVALEEVKNLTLKANSSHVTIDRLMKSARIENNLGQVHINYVSDNFDTMDIVLLNGELICATPTVPYKFRFEGTSSEFIPPSYLQLTKSKDQNQTDYQGYHLNKSSDRSILINSRYSEVTLRQ